MKYVGIAAACLSSFVSISSAYAGNSWEFRVVNKSSGLIGTEES